MPKIDKFLKFLMSSGASDLHMRVTLPPRVRLHGGIRNINNEEPLTEESMIMYLREIADDAQWERFITHHDLDFAYGIPGVARFRANYLYTREGPAAVFRVIPTKILTLEDLNMPPILRDISLYKSGLVLVTGPTGSGKSTTLAAMIHHMNTNVRRHIVTIEDPIEFVHDNRLCTFSQREVEHDTESFSNALRSSLRQDPDVVLVGEMRDLETIGLALSAANMGFLVFGTLHTNNAGKTIDRIINVFPAEQQPQVRGMLAECLKGVISQLLLKTRDGKGRVAVNEILLSTQSLPAIIREGKISKIYSVIASGRDQGMQAMDDKLLELVEGGKISNEDAFMKAGDKKRFEHLMEDEDIGEE
ncbi:MAG: type IV pilus twitching motility protein PilT [Planctomycetota bacterium]|jgi:twitching motility protein PilT